ncbi:NERD domain-containing protein [Lysinibacillus macroides]|uniref:NERD domain-containing protein n=1 Tax=Lysinibacillus macroides TaxID=33935 RepID=A0A0N0CX31_9BACI|nr:nuclease-related domain-containing protein [Lysinibacillus macroides]KOY83995.1 hypothetical protein ADM90_00865 [Lysinibacillus macroides]QPR66764.1 NERD domain-containing protein [Lysinibacillus macroides]
MFVKQREKSFKQLVLEALDRRLPKNHTRYEYFQEMLRRVRAGYAGEQHVDKVWQEINLQQPYVLLHDVEFQSMYQMDTLFLTQNFVLVIEIKNMVGRVEYMKEKHQFIRIHADGKVEGFRNPFDQVKRHARFLSKFLNERGYVMPIKYLVVAANPNMVMSSSLCSQPILHVSGLGERIERLLKQHQTIYIDKEELSELCTYMLQHHEPSQWNFTISRNELRKGALCSHCSFAYVVSYTYGRWRCTHCHKVDEQAFWHALQDYRLLIGEQISKAEFCVFFNMSSERAAYYLLKKLKFKAVGQNKNRKYIIRAK